MSDFPSGILSEFLMFSYTFRLRMAFFNIFFLEQFPFEPPKAIDKTPHPSWVKSFGARYRENLFAAQGSGELT